MKNVIQIEEEDFFRLVEEVIKRLEKKMTDKDRNRWVDTDEAMSILKIKSKTSLQKLRDNGEIRYSHPAPKIIVYDRLSLEKYLDKHAKDTF